MRGSVRWKNVSRLTVTMVDTMIMSTLAIAEMTASMAPPMADTMAPWKKTRRQSLPSHSKTRVWTDHYGLFVK